MAYNNEEECKNESLLLGIIIAIFLLFIYLMTLFLYPRPKRMRSCNYVSIELPSAIYKGNNFIGVGSGPSGAPTLPSLFLTAAELAAFAYEPMAPRRSLQLSPEEKLILRAESRSGCYVKGKEITLFKWRYSDVGVMFETATRDNRTVADATTMGTVETVNNTSYMGTTMVTADTVDVERRYRKKGSKAVNEEGSEY
uniref:Wsv216 n=1 Tax=Haemonchus contortus TaxID=6289 RepID=A0A7I4YRT1_HAECO